MRFIFRVDATERHRYEDEIEADSLEAAQAIAEKMFEDGEWGDESFSQETIDADWSVKPSKV